MPDPTTAIALLLLVAFAEASPYVRLPIGLLLAIALLATDAVLLPIALIGAAGVMLARLSLALGARRGRDRLAAASPAVQARRAAMQRQLSGSPAYARMTFLLAAMPGMPAGFIFPLLGAMRAPLWPALLGTLAGRTPLLALTAAIFTWLGRAISDGDEQAALTLGVMAMLLLVFRSVSLIDFQHRTETGKWRLRDPDEHAARMATMFGGPADGAAGRGGGWSATWPPREAGAGRGAGDDDDHDIVEGELLGEELDGEGLDGDEPSGDEPPASLPPGGGAH
jgi:membrane protein YqaA with SNARE-associated domain